MVIFLRGGRGWPELDEQVEEETYPWARPRMATGARGGHNPARWALLPQRPPPQSGAEATRHRPTEPEARTQTRSIFEAQGGRHGGLRGPAAGWGASCAPRPRRQMVHFNSGRGQAFAGKPLRRAERGHGGILGPSFLFWCRLDFLAARGAAALCARGTSSARRRAIRF